MIYGRFDICYESVDEFLYHHPDPSLLVYFKDLPKSRAGKSFTDNLSPEGKIYKLEQIAHLDLRNKWLVSDDGFVAKIKEIFVYRRRIEHLNLIRIKTAFFIGGLGERCHCYFRRTAIKNAKNRILSEPKIKFFLAFLITKDIDFAMEASFPEKYVFRKSGNTNTYYNFIFNQLMNAHVIRAFERKFMELSELKRILSESGGDVEETVKALVEIRDDKNNRASDRLESCDRLLKLSGFDLNEPIGKQLEEFKNSKTIPGVVKKNLLPLPVETTEVDNA